MKTSLFVVVFALVQAALAADPITVDVSSRRGGGGGGGGGGGPGFDLSSSELTNKYCCHRGKSCDKPEILKSVFATTRDLMMSQCNNKLECLGVSIDDMRYAHFQGERCTEAELTDSENNYFYRLRKGESCTAPAELHVRAEAKYSASFCMVARKACPGHGLYKQPQNIPNYIKCLEKCAKIKECTGVDFHLRDNKQCEPIIHKCNDEDLQDEEITTHYVRLLKGVTSCADARITGTTQAGEPQEPTEAPTETPTEEPEPVTAVDPEEPTEIPTEPPTEAPTAPPTEQPIVNLAQSKRTYQSGIGWNGASSRAVDGNPSGNYWDHSCTHTDKRYRPYWVVDLGESADVTGIQIVNRRDCCSDRLKNFLVVVTNTKPAGDSPSYTDAEICGYRKGSHQGALNLKCGSALSGRYVMIQLQYTEYLTLCEVRVYAGELPEGNWLNGDALEKNLAWRKATWQSSIGWKGESSRAVDGNDSGNYWRHSCTHTAKGDKPYWAVDLGQAYGVTGVSIANRNDCCSDRLKNFKVVVTNTKPAGNSPSYTDCEVCFSRKNAFTGTINLKCGGEISGRYVMIQLQDRDYLTLCEVAVYAGELPEGTWIEGDSVTGNLAKGKVTWQSGIGWHGSSSRAVDGNLSGKYWDHSCTHTDKRDKPYWTVDLGEEYGVTGVSITNRKDCCSDRLRSFKVVVTNTKPTGDYPSYADSEVCAYRMKSHSGTLGIKCTGPSRGRYVMIQLQYKEYLTLCEVAVYAGTLPEGNWVEGDNANGNLALVKSTWQSGIGWNGASSRAVDGNDSGNYGDHSCTHTDHRDKPYWVVDLGQAYAVTGISITNRKDCCSDRLRSFKVVVTNTKPTGDSPSYTDSEVCAYRMKSHSGTLGLKCTGPSRGRYVMIQLQYKEYLTLCEVAVYAGTLPEGNWVEGDNANGNLALVKSTWQSGIGWNGASSRAVDGNDSGNYGDHSCTHTDHRDKPYWVVDLGQAYGVTGISITNRKDCCSSRLKNFNVVVTDTAPAGASPTYTEVEVCAFRMDSHSGTLNLKCGSEIKGRYVMIQLQYKEYLTLCEVKVYTGALPAGTWVNGDSRSSSSLSQGKFTYQSGIGWNGQSSRAVDGNTSGNYGHHSCTHTDKRDKPYWVVDLGRAYTVTSVAITNRADCCHTRLQKYRIVVTNTKPAGTYPSYTQQEICHYSPGTHSGTKDVKCDRSVSGRYVMIQLQYQGYLTLCEVKVNGY